MKGWQMAGSGPAQERHRRLSNEALSRMHDSLLRSTNLVDPRLSSGPDTAAAQWQSRVGACCVSVHAASAEGSLAQ